MPIKRETVGSGLTKRRRIIASGRLSEKDKRVLAGSVALYNKHGATFERMVADWERTAKRILKKVDHSYIAEPQTPEWYAHEILWRIEHVKANIPRGEAAATAKLALQVGLLVAEAHFKEAWELATIQGRKSIAGGDKGARIAHGPPKKRLEDKRERAETYRSFRKKGYPIEVAKRKAATACGCSSTTIGRARKAFNIKD